MLEKRRVASLGQLAEFALRCCPFLIKLCIMESKNAYLDARDNRLFYLIRLTSNAFFIVSSF